ncbi:hypothetical protein HN873_036340 [Arachis hypogaea]
MDREKRGEERPAQPSPPQRRCSYCLLQSCEKSSSLPSNAAVVSHMRERERERQIREELPMIAAVEARLVAVTTNEAARSRCRARVAVRRRASLTLSRRSVATAIRACRWSHDCP